jgi:hypothetical protein
LTADSTRQCSQRNPSSYCKIFTFHDIASHDCCNMDQATSQCAPVGSIRRSHVILHPNLRRASHFLDVKMSAPLHSSTTKQWGCGEQLNHAHWCSHTFNHLLNYLLKRSSNTTEKITHCAASSFTQ